MAEHDLTNPSDSEGLIRTTINETLSEVTPIIVIGPDMIISEASIGITARVGNIIGITYTEFIEQFVHHEDRDSVDVMLRGQIIGEKVVPNSRFRLAREDSVLGWYEMQAFSIAGATEQSFVFIFKDVTQQVQTEADLEAARALTPEQYVYAALYNNLSVIAIDPAGNIAMVSGAFSEWFPGDATSVVKQPLVEVLRPYVKADDLGDIEAIAGTPDILAQNSDLRRICFNVNGAEVYFDVRVSQVEVSNGFCMYVILLSDVSKDVLLRHLMSGLAHDVKAPLNTASLALTVLETGDLSRAERARTRLTSQVKAATEMIAELLDMLRVERGEFTLERSFVDIPALLRDLQSEFGVVAINQGIDDFEFVIKAGFPRVMCDSPRLTRVLRNLIGNALKYTPPKSKVMVYAGRNPSANDQWILLVHNTGVSIREEDLARIGTFGFRPSGNSQGGHGFGLWVSREIICAHGWDLHITSDQTPDNEAVAAFIVINQDDIVTSE